MHCTDYSSEVFLQSKFLEVRGFPICLQDSNVKECCVQDLVSGSATLQQLVKDAGTGTHNMIYRFQHFLIQCELKLFYSPKCFKTEKSAGEQT